MGPPLAGPPSGGRPRARSLPRASPLDVKRGDILLSGPGRGARAGLTLAHLGHPRASPPLAPGGWIPGHSTVGGPLLGESVCLSPHQGPEPHRVGWGVVQGAWSKQGATVQSRTRRGLAVGELWSGDSRQGWGALMCLPSGKKPFLIGKGEVPGRGRLGSIRKCSSQDHFQSPSVWPGRKESVWSQRRPAQQGPAPFAGTRR